MLVSRSVSEELTQTDSNPLYILDTTASPAESISVTSELRMSVQPAKPALPIKLLREQLPKADVFSAHKIFTTFCASFRSL